MTLFWVVAAFLTAAVGLLLLRPLIRRDSGMAAGGSDLAVYREQLAELERDRARGLIEADEFASLEAEIGRRMLRASRAGEAAIPAETKPVRWLAVAVAVLVPVGALLVYLSIGRPDMPGMPLAQRQISPGEDPAKLLAAVDQVRAKLKPVKEDLDRWLTVGQAYTSLGRPRDAVEAFRIVVQLSPNDPSIGAALGEALIAADGGAVGEEAKELFRKIPEDSPARPAARFYLALGDAQAGDMKAALAGWQSLLRDSPADAPWVEPTRAQIATAAKSLGLDPAKEMPATLAPAAPALPGPNSAQADAIAKMTPEQQAEMIRTMVAKLAARLEANPDNAVGWRQLAKAYQVLGEPDKARVAEERASQAEAKAGAKP
jgi:cytochrome c-type biogenesis protein CcmH